MRAREPDHDGYVERDGVKIHYEVFGSGEPTILLLPTWSVIHSRFWKLQVPYLSRHFRVITFDGRGTGASDRPADPSAYTHLEFADDALAVLDATGTERVVQVALSCGSLWGIQLAADHPDRTLGLVCIGPAVPLPPALAERQVHDFDVRYDAYEGWAKYNRHYWTDGDYADFLQFFFGRMFPEPHSTEIEDCVAWGLEIAPGTLAAARDGLEVCGRESFRAVCEQVAAPVLVIHGTEDGIRSHESGVALAELTSASMITIEGGGHGPQGRDPVWVNLAIKDFVETVAPSPRRATWTRALRRPKRALYLSSPIGLGHARRDLAIARELRNLHPGLEIDWLAQHPVTALLTTAGERVHPASRQLASESAHVEHEAGEHDLHAFQAIRRMDEILVANFMTFHDVVAATPYDLVIGDEAWDVDYFLHENPELKRFAFAWMTDFVGWLPMPAGGAAEAALTADYNAEMIEHRARFRRVRDVSIFVGDPADVVPDSFGPGLPPIRDWVEANFDFAGYVSGFDPAVLRPPAAIRAEYGIGADEPLCVVTVGGSGVGASLLRRVMEAIPLVRRQVPGLRFLVVAGPRISPRSLPQPEGTQILGFVPDLVDHLAACDIAVVQGGLTTCMELVATGTPFLYFPLANHFEQQIHVAHRLERYGAGRRLDYVEADPGTIADAITRELGSPAVPGPVGTDGAARAASMIAALL